MYSDKKSVLQLTALLKAHGVKKVVICVGRQQIPLVQTLTHDSDFSCYPATDERTGGFFALGLALHEATPVAIVCSTGSALANLHPAVAEAYYQQVPLVVVSVDVTPTSLDKTLKQPLALQDVTKWSVNLPIAHTPDEEELCNRLINEALLETNHHGKGPVHINLPLEEPLFDFNTMELPEVRVIRRYQGLNMYEQDYQPLVDSLNKFKKRMVIAGQMNMIYLFDKKYESTLSKQFVWLTENLSNHTTPNIAIRRIDELLYPMDLKMQQNLSPELLITFGGKIMSRRLKYFLRKHRPLEHWHVSKDGEINDAFGALTKVIEMDPFEFLEKVAPLIEDVPPTYPRQWKLLEEKLHEPRFVYSSMSAVGKLIASLPKGCSLHLGNGSAVRYAQLFPMPEDVEIQANVGLEGAEGSLATALGYATASEKINFVVIGDMGFFNGMNALCGNNYGSNIRILVINNGGYGQMQDLPGFTPDDHMQRFLFGNHQTSAKAWAEDKNFGYMSVRNDEELEAAMQTFIQPGITRQPLIMEVFTDKVADADYLKQYFKELRTR